MAIEQEDIDRLRASLVLSDVVSQYVALRRVGRNQVGLCPFHAERSGSFNVRDETGRYRCFGCGAAGDVIKFVQEIDHVDFVTAVEQLAIEGRHPAALHRCRSVEGSIAAQVARRRDGQCGRVVPPTSAHIARCARGARLPAPPRSVRRRGPSVQARVGARRLGRPVPRPEDAGRRVARHRPRLHQQGRPPAGLVPRPGDVPDLHRERRAGGLRRPHHARQQRPGEVQELVRDAHLRQVEDAVRTALGQGRHRRCRSGHRVRGLHRRHRVPSSGSSACGRHLWHRTHRGPRTAVEALRQPGGAGVRCRCRRPGRGAAVLRVGGQVQGPRQRGPLPAGHGPRRAQREGPRRAEGRGRPRLAVPGLPPQSGVEQPAAALARGPRAHGPGGHGHRRRASRLRTCRSCTPGRSPRTSACR